MFLMNTGHEESKAALTSDDNEWGIAEIFFWVMPSPLDKLRAKPPLSFGYCAGSYFQQIAKTMRSNSPKV